jgi:hypothetical protein
MFWLPTRRQDVMFPEINVNGWEYWAKQTDAPAALCTGSILVERAS